MDGCIKRRRTFNDLQIRPIAKAWRTPLQKAAGEDPETQYKWLHDLADSAAEPIREAFIRAIEKIRGTSKEAQIADALATGDVDAVMEVLDLDTQIADAVRTQIVPALEDTMIAAGRQAPAETIPVEGELAMRFDIANPNVVRFIRQYDLGLIQQITDDSREAIRGVVANALEFGGHPREQARLIRQSIGLTENQAAAVDNFRALLESGDRGALDRELRDRRFDLTLQRTLGEDAVDTLSPDQIDTMVQRYGERMLSARAENIARTETIRAAEAGKQMAWNQAADDGLLSRTSVRQGWLVTPDDRLCIICAAIPLMNLDGVPLGGSFVTPVGPVDAPPVHPQCRCSTYLLAF